MVLGQDVGSARVTITDVATKQILATGIQQGEPATKIKSCGRHVSWKSRIIVPDLPQPLPQLWTCSVPHWLK
jgi:hypothetical protein